MNNILVVNVNWVGDVILSTPVFKALKQAYPGAKISCLGVPRVKDILECSPCVDEIIVYDEKGKHRSLIGKIKILSELRKRRFDCVFLLHRSYTRALLVYLAGIPKRVGYDTKGRGSLLTHKVNVLPDWPHRSDHYLNVIESFGIEIKDRDCELKVSDESTVEIEEILKKHNIQPGENFVVVNTGGNWNLKRWPKKKLASLIKQLTEKYHAKVVIPGAPKDVELARTIARLSGVNPFVLAGETNLKQLIALMKKAQVVVSADSGPMHIANCVGTQVIALFGPTRPEITGPRGKGKYSVIQNDVGCNREPCYYLNCTDNVCMQSIMVYDVLQEIGKVKN